jgi:hypothetical protein
MLPNVINNEKGTKKAQIEMQWACEKARHEAAILKKPTPIWVQGHSRAEPVSNEETRDQADQFLAAASPLALAMQLQNWGSLKDKVSSHLEPAHPVADRCHLVCLHDENDGNGDRQKPMNFGFS